MNTLLIHNSCNIFKPSPKKLYVYSKTLEILNTFAQNGQFILKNPERPNYKGVRVYIMKHVLLFNVLNVLYKLI